MTSEPMWPVAPVIKIMSCGPLLEIGFGVRLEWAQLRLAGAAPRDETVGRLTSFGVCERLIG